jgi:hypothetical protein
MFLILCPVETLHIIKLCKYIVDVKKSCTCLASLRCPCMLLLFKFYTTFAEHIPLRDQDLIVTEWCYSSRVRFMVNTLFEEMTLLPCVCICVYLYLPPVAHMGESSRIRLFKTLVSVNQWLNSLSAG